MKTLLSSLLLAFCFFASVQACETCAIYTPPDWRMYLPQEDGAAEEHGMSYKLNLFSRYSKLDERTNGDDEESNPGEEIESWISQLSLEAAVTPDLHLQLSLPYFNREFRQIDGDGFSKGSESGIGDLVFMGKYTAWRKPIENGEMRLKVIAGIKAPTGDSDQLRSGGHAHGDTAESGHDDDSHSEGGHQDVDGADHDGEGGHMDADDSDDGHSGNKAQTGHSGSDSSHSAATAIAGHDLATGSGSWDLIGGLLFDVQQGDVFADAMAKYYLRTEGDHNYEYADDLYVSAHVGRFLYRKNGRTISLRGGFLGEFRDADEQDGEEIGHTALDAWYVDATLMGTTGNLVAEIGIDQPISRDTGGSTLLPENRVRLSLGLHF